MMEDKEYVAVLTRNTPISELDIAVKKLKPETTINEITQWADSMLGNCFLISLRIVELEEEKL